MKSTTSIKTIILALTMLFGFAANATAQTYHADDKAALRAFLRQPSAEEDKANLEQLGLTPADTLNWQTNDAWLTKLTDLTWNTATPKRITEIDWFNKKLAGSLDVSGCTSLQTLYCNSNALSTLDVSGLTSLQNLRCSYNKLSTLDVSGLTSLVELYCFNSTLTSLDVSGLTNLTHLWCNNSTLTSLDASGCTSLVDLYCDDNELTSLNVSGCTSLVDLRCYSNALTALDVSGLTSLVNLTCFNNALTSLDVSGLTSLVRLRCENNSLTSLNVSGATGLQDLWCNANQLSTLDVSGLTSLETLNCYYNALTMLDVSGLSSLRNLCCNNNVLTALNVSGLTSLQTLYCYNNQLLLSQLYAVGSLVSNIDNKRLGTQQPVLFESKALLTGETLDLSSEKAFGGVNTVYTVKKNGNTAVLGTDYAISEGVITCMLDGKYTVEMTNTAIESYSNYPAVAVTGEITVGESSSHVDDVENTGIEIYLVPEGIAIVGASLGEDIQIYNVSGTLVTATQYRATPQHIALPRGAYIVQVGDKVTKVIR